MGHKILYRGPSEGQASAPASQGVPGFSKGPHWGRNRLAPHSSDPAGGTRRPRRGRCRSRDDVMRRRAVGDAWRWTRTDCAYHPAGLWRRRHGRHGGFAGDHSGRRSHRLVHGGAAARWGPAPPRLAREAISLPHCPVAAQSPASVEGARDRALISGRRLEKFLWWAALLPYLVLAGGGCLWSLIAAVCVCPSVCARGLVCVIDRQKDGCSYACCNAHKALVALLHFTGEWSKQYSLVCNQNSLM